MRGMPEWEANAFTPTPASAFAKWAEKFTDERIHEFAKEVEKERENELLDRLAKAHPQALRRIRNRINRVLKGLKKNDRHK